MPKGQTQPRPAGSVGILVKGRVPPAPSSSPPLPTTRVTDMCSVGRGWVCRVALATSSPACSRNRDGGRTPSPFRGAGRRHVGRRRLRRPDRAGDARAREGGPGPGTGGARPADPRGGPRSPGLRPPEARGRRGAGRLVAPGPPRTGHYQQGDVVGREPRQGVARTRPPMGTIREHDAAWRAWFDAQGVRPHAVAHERPVGDRRGVVEGIAAGPAVGLPGDRRPRSPRRKQADGPNRTRAGALRASMGRRVTGPPPGTSWAGA